MSATGAGLRAPRPMPSGNPRWVIMRHVARSAMRTGVIWGVVFGLFVISTVKAFVVGYPTVAERLQLARSLQSMAMLLGVPRHLETVAGFTSWRILLVVAIMGAIWGLLTSTGLLRGEEESGRWELLLAGQTTRRSAAVQALLGLGAVLVAMFVATAVLTVVAGRVPGARFSTGGSLLFAAALVSGAAMFLAIGALASQLSANRGQAAMISAGILAASYVVRMVADSRSALGWMRWISPLGWIEELRPLQNAQLLALAPIAGLVLVCAILTVLLAGRRDLNASVFREGEGHLRDPRWLVGPTTLALRLSRNGALAWLFGMAVMAATYGSLTRSATSILADSPAVAAALGKLGIRRAAEGYLGIIFLMVELLLAVIAATQIAAIRDEEASARLDNLLVRPVRRVTWLVGRLAVSLSIILLAGLIGGLFVWLGALDQHTGVNLPRLLEAGLNATPPAIFVLGAGTLVLGLRPRVSSAVAYGIVAWSFLVELLGSVVKGSTWLRDSSLFAHIALAPAAKANWETDAIIVLLGGAVAAIGVVAFQRRDVEYT